MKFDFKLSPDTERLPPMGLIVLQVDETTETEFRQTFSGSQDQLFVTRIPSGLEVTAKQLSNMEGNIKAAANLLPQSRELSLIHISEPTRPY